MSPLRHRLALVVAVACVAFGAAAAPPTGALVKHEDGRREVLGVQLLQDADDDDVYFYLPQFPRLATNDDGTLALLCLKFLDAEGGTSGGLFHALIEFTLPTDAVAAVEAALREELPGARIAGPVPMTQAVSDGADGVGSFEVVSALLADQGEGGFTRSLVTSGKAPLAPGSRAVVAALLDPRGATLLWDSLTGPTSDVSVAVHGAYEAQVPAYNARVSAEVETVYDHLSRIENVQGGFSRRQVREVVDELVQNGDLEVAVIDRSQGLGIDTGDMAGILDLVTAKLTELMFDAESGWAREPPREDAVEQGQIQGRQQRGFFSRVFRGARDVRYLSDDQFVLKDRQEIRRHTFALTLDRRTTIRVPVDTAGNLGGLYDALGDDQRYFRVVDLADPAFEIRRVHFQVDGAYVDAFQDLLDFVSVNVRQAAAVRPDGAADRARTLTFSHGDVAAGITVQHVAVPRLGAAGDDWTELEYQVVWGVRGRDDVREPADPTRWLRTRDAVVSLAPPFVRLQLEIDADRALFADRGVRTAVVEVGTVLAGEARVDRRATLRRDDTEATTAVVLYHDRDQPVALRVSWFAPTGTVRGPLELLDTDYLFLTPPELPAEDAASGEPVAGEATPSGAAPTEARR